MKNYSDPMMKLVRFDVADNTNAFETKDESGIDFGDLQDPNPGEIIASNEGSGSITTTWLA